MSADEVLIRERVRQRFRQERGPLRDPADRLVELVREEGPLVAPADARRWALELRAELVGLGPLQELLDDPEVTDVLVNGPGPVWVERAGRMLPSGLCLDHEQILLAVERLAAPLGLWADRAHPIVEGRLPDGTRVSAVLEPLAVGGPVLALRRHGRTAHGLDELCDPDVAEVLRRAVHERDNLVVHGETGSGKTTLLRALCAEVPDGERMVVIEDVTELRPQGANVVSLEARPGDGLGTTLRELVRVALRLRPDRIVVGEVRGAEAADMVWALSTGHRGCMSSLHAGSAPDALSRLETMVVLGLGESVPLEAVREQVRSAVDVLVAMRREPGGRRRVVAVERCPRGAIDPEPTT